MNSRISFLIVLFFLFSCEKDEFIPVDSRNYSPDINFDISEWIFKGRSISCVDFDKNGDAWIGSGSDLIFYDGYDTLVYDAESIILDLAIAPNDDVWLGTKEKGLACFSNKQFTWFTVENSKLPRNYVHSVEVATNGKVWFCSAAHDLGGVMNYDGKRFKLFSPDNSILNQHVIQNLKIDKNNTVYFHSQGKVGNSAVFKISNNGNCKQLGEGTGFYWLMSLDITFDSKVYVSTDHSLSSCSNCYTNGILFYEKEKWNSLETPFDMNFFSRFFLDKRDYVWVINSGNDYFGYSVFDGIEWYHSQKGQIPEMFFNTVKADENNNLWFCTNDGIYILKQ